MRRAFETVAIDRLDRIGERAGAGGAWPGRVPWQGRGVAKSSGEWLGQWQGEGRGCGIRGTVGAETWPRHQECGHGSRGVAGAGAAAGCS